MKQIVLVVMILLSTSIYGSAQEISCTGAVSQQIDLTKVTLSSDNGKYYAIYPNSFNIKFEVQKIFKGETLLVLGSISDGGAGFWVINTQSWRYSYMQTKDISEYSDASFNSDQYVGQCEKLTGDLTKF